MSYVFAPACLSNFFTPFYDLVVEQGGLGKSFQKKILKFVDIKDGESILDVGCGTGTFVIEAKSQYPNNRIVGVDVDENILKIAKKKLAKNNLTVELIQSGAEKLPFESQSFNVIVSSLTLHHLPTDIKKQALKEIYRVLKKDGRFLLADIGKQDELFWKIKFALDFESLFSATKEYMKDNFAGRIPVFVGEAGFIVKEITPKHRGIQFLLGKKR